MKRTLYLLPLLCLVILLVSCRKEERGSLVPEASQYRLWEQPIPVILDYPIPGHEDNRRRIFINPRGTEVRIEQLENRVYWDYPEGTVIVKEIIAGLEGANTDSPFQITAMVKASRDPQSRGGWLWIVKPLDSDEETIVDWEFCFDCHANANEPHPYGDGNTADEFRDYVFFPYRKP
ncbi:MAG: cytochrome P460 family protein [Spirochaetaceae bacterium]|nr:MAG: cytochrome P460 family protein [Spirochaetaceae bacterium]